MTDFEGSEFRNRIQQFVASKAGLLFKLKGKEKLRSGIDYNVDRAQEAYSIFAFSLPPLENGMQISIIERRAQIFELLKIGDIVVGKVVGKCPFGVFVRILSLVHGRNLDFNDIDIQALCPKSELEKDHKTREHLDPIDDFDVDDIVQGVICSISRDEERIAISFRSSKLPSEYGNIELGVIEDLEEKNLRAKSFDDLEYNEHLRKDPGFSNPTNVQTLLDILGIDSSPPNSLLSSCQRWKFINNEADDLRKKQSEKWSMETTATGVENFKSGDHEKALKYFNHALKICEENCEALVARGALYANQDKLEYAIKDFKEALKLHPRHHNARKYLKETLFEKATRLKDVSNIKDAISVFEEVLELDPRSIESQEHLKQLKSALAAKLAEEERRARKAASLRQEGRKKFDHVRKLIKSDPDVVKSRQKKKRKKKKIKKGKSRKRRRNESETTSTASEGSRDSSGDEWIEKDLKKNSPRKMERKEFPSRESQAVHSHVSSGNFSSISQPNDLDKEERFHEQSFDPTNSLVADVEHARTAVGQDVQDTGNLGLLKTEERNKEPYLDKVERQKRERVERGSVQQTKETKVGTGGRNKIKNELNYVTKEMFGSSRRERSLSRGSRSRSKSRGKEDGNLVRRRSAVCSGMKSSESDAVSSGESYDRRRRRRKRRSSSDGSFRAETRKKMYSGTKRQNNSRRKDIDRDSSDGSDRGSIRLDGNSSRVDDGKRGERRVVRDRRGEMRRGRLSTSSDRSERERSRSNSLRRDRSSIMRAGRDSWDRQGTNRDREGQRSSSTDRTRRRSGEGRRRRSGDRSGQQGSVRYDGGRQSRSEDSSGQRDT